MSFVFTNQFHCLGIKYVDFSIRTTGKYLLIYSSYDVDCVVVLLYHVGFKFTKNPPKKGSTHTPNHNIVCMRTPGNWPDRYAYEYSEKWVRVHTFSNTIENKERSPEISNSKESSIRVKSDSAVSDIEYTLSKCLLALIIIKVQPILIQRVNSILSHSQSHITPNSQWLDLHSLCLSYILFKIIVNMNQFVRLCRVDHSILIILDHQRKWFSFNRYLCYFHCFDIKDSHIFIGMQIEINPFIPTTAYDLTFLLYFILKRHIEIFIKFNESICYG